MVRRCLRSPAWCPAPWLPAQAATSISVLTPEQVAQTLGVTPADVMQELEAGTLKGRKIGSQWRIPQAALDEFLKG